MKILKNNLPRLKILIEIGLFFSIPFFNNKIFHTNNSIYYTPNALRRHTHIAYIYSIKNNDRNSQPYNTHAA